MPILDHPLEVKRRVCYVQTTTGWQTYVFDALLHPYPYKLLTTEAQLKQAIAACQTAGWIMTDATTIVHQLQHYS